MKRDSVNVHCSARGEMAVHVLIAPGNDRGRENRRGWVERASDVVFVRRKRDHLRDCSGEGILRFIPELIDLNLALVPGYEGGYECIPIGEIGDVSGAGGQARKGIRGAG
jgi:hypothetical protein